MRSGPVMMMSVRQFSDHPASQGQGQAGVSVPRLGSGLPDTDRWQ